MIQGDSFITKLSYFLGKFMTCFRKHYISLEFKSYYDRQFEKKKIIHFNFFLSIFLKLKTLIGKKIVILNCGIYLIKIMMII